MAEEQAKKGQPGRRRFALWARAPIKYKLGLIFGLILLLTFLMLYYSLNWSQRIMQETYLQENKYYNINSFQNTLIQAGEELQSYLRSPGEGAAYADAWREDVQAMQRQLILLDVDRVSVGDERYLLANGIIHGFTPYTEAGEELLGMWEHGGTLPELYTAYARVEKISGYLQQYTRQLQSKSLSAGQSNLADLRVRSGEMKSTFLAGIAVGYLVLTMLLLELVRSIVTPVLRLSEESKAIGAGNFDTPDLTVNNRDEIYTLVRAFNRMKHSMQITVRTLRERSEMEQALHQKELEASESRRLMEQAKMQQLRSQINPHFLFNTLNIISRTARKEKAAVSEKLILSLARLFRYGLKTDDVEVPLQREVNIVNDYITIQEARFAGRVTLQWRIAEDVAPDTLLVPAFLLQPLVENCIIHGLGPKLEGGTVRVRIHLRAGVVHITVTDNGAGMDAATLQRLVGQQTTRGDVSGIGVGNVKTRLQMLDPAATFAVHSREGRGTSVFITLAEHRFADRTAGGISL